MCYKQLKLILFKEFQKRALTLFHRGLFNCINPSSEFPPTVKQSSNIALAIKSLNISTFDHKTKFPLSEIALETSLHRGKEMGPGGK
jgi:hypothetical protein